MVAFSPKRTHTFKPAWFGGHTSKNSIVFGTERYLVCQLAHCFWWHFSHFLAFLHPFPDFSQIGTTILNLFNIHNTLIVNDPLPRPLSFNARTPKKETMFKAIQTNEQSHKNSFHILSQQRKLNYIVNGISHFVKICDENYTNNFHCFCWFVVGFVKTTRKSNKSLWALKAFFSINFSPLRLLRFIY